MSDIYDKFAMKYLKLIDEDNDSEFSKLPKTDPERYLRIKHAFERAVVLNKFKPTNKNALRKVFNIWRGKYRNVIEVLSFGEDSEREQIINIYPELKEVNDAIDEIF